MFDLSNVKAAGSFETLPAGKYTARITNAEIKDTKTPGGQYIKAELTISTGEHNGRKIWTNFNVKNNNAQAVEIGLAQLKSMLEHAGVTSTKLNSVGDLLGLTVGVKTKVKTDEYGEKSEVQYFFTPQKESGQSLDTLGELPNF